MSPREQHDDFEPSKHKRGTEWRLALGGFTIVLVIGGILLWLFWGLTLAFIGVGIALVAVAIFAFLVLLLRALEAWAKSG